MALTKISGEVIQSGINIGIVTATQVNVGSEVTIHTGGFRVGTSDLHSTGLNLGSGNIISHNISSTGIITATSFSGNITGNLTGDINSTGVSTFSTIKVGTAVTISGGIVSATSFYGDGTNLTNTGSTLSAASGSQRIVLTGQTSGTMTASATDSTLTFAQSTGTLSATKFIGDGSALTSIAANQVLTQSNTTNADYFVTFVDSNNGSATSETIYTDADISYNPSTNLLKVSGAVRIGAANLSSGGDYAHLATYEYYNGSSWVYSSATAGGLYQITGQAHNWSKHNGAGTHTTLLTLDASGNLVATANVTAYSDIKLKENINTIENALDKTLKLRGVTFTRKDIPDEGTQIGVIAQEVEEIIPEAVKLNIIETPEGTVDEIKTVAYGNLVGLLIEAIKEQQKTVKKLEKRIEDLEIVITQH